MGEDGRCYCAMLITVNMHVTRLLALYVMHALTHSHVLYVHLEDC